MRNPMSFMFRSEFNILKIFWISYWEIIQDILLQEDTKGVIRIRNSKKNRQRNGQEKKDRQRSTKHTIKTKDRVTRTPLKTGDELRCTAMGSTSGTCRFITIYLAMVIVVDINEIRTETKICKVKCGQIITALHRVRNDVLLKHFKAILTSVRNIQ
jgi:hypothetical protein